MIRSYSQTVNQTDEQEPTQADHQRYCQMKLEYLERNRDATWEEIEQGLRRIAEACEV